MDRITITEAGRAILDLDTTNTNNTSLLPTITNHHSSTTHFEENKTFMKHSASKTKLDVVGLRTILRD